MGMETIRDFDDDWPKNIKQLHLLLANDILFHHLQSKKKVEENVPQVRFRWDPDHTQTVFTAQGRPFELILCRCMHCLPGRA